MPSYDIADIPGACPVCQGNNPDCQWCDGTGVDEETRDATE